MTQNISGGGDVEVARVLSAVTDFFREDTGEVVGIYFDGETIFLSRAAEIVEVAAADDIAQLAEKTSETCRQRNWQTQTVGFCLRDSEVVTMQTEFANVPEKEYPNLVESWSRAQAGDDSLNSFVQIGNEVWMETFPKSLADEICAAFRKFGLDLIALSVMPPAPLTKRTSPERARFIAEVVAKEISPNFLQARGTSWNVQKLSATAAMFFLIAALVHSAGIFSDWLTASNELDTAKLSLGEMRDDLNIKNFIDDDAGELCRLNDSVAKLNAAGNFNLLANLGKSFGGDVRLTKIRVDENLAQVDGLAKSTDTVKGSLARVKNSVTQSARLENSSARDDGEFVFTIRADLK